VKRIALLRSNPRDATYEKVIGPLIKEHHVTCYIWDRTGDYRPGIQDERVRYKVCPYRAGYHDARTAVIMILFNIWLFVHLLFSRFDAIHAIDLDTGLTGLLISKIRGKQFVYHCEDPYSGAVPAGWPGVLRWIVHRLENCVISGSDVFIISDLLRMPQHEGSRPRKVVEFANVPHIELPRTKAEPHSGFVVGYIGSLIEGRNLATLIDAAGELAEKDVVLIIGGFGPLEENIRMLTERYGNVHFAPWMPYEEVLEREWNFDVMVHITDNRHEGQKWVSPNKLFESMALGKPIIVGEGTVSAAHVDRVKNGLTVPSGDKESLKEAIIQLHDDAGLRNMMGKRGKEEFLRAWHPAIMEQRLLDIYRD